MFTSVALCIQLCNAIYSDSAEKVPVDQIFEESYVVANRLRSIDLVFSFKGPGRGPRAMRLRQRGGKLRGDAYCAPYNPNAEAKCVDIFDGTTLIKYSPGTRQLGTTERPTDALVLTFNDPLCMTYGWLMEHALWSSLQTRSHALWLESASVAELQTPTVVNGINCQCVQIPGLNGTRVILEIADGLRIPLKWTQLKSSDDIMNQVTVQEWKEYPTRVGTVVLPTVVDCRSRLKLKEGTFHENRYIYKVDVSTVRVNEDIAEDVFSIPTSQIAELYNRDTDEILYPLTGVVRNLKDEPDRNQRPAQMASTRTWLILANVFLVAGFAGIWWFNRRRRST